MYFDLMGPHFVIAIRSTLAGEWYEALEYHWLALFNLVITFSVHRLFHIHFPMPTSHHSLHKAPMVYVSWIWVVSVLVVDFSVGFS